MKVAAAVILFNPDENVADRILSYANHVSKLYLLDNTENNMYSKELLREILNLNHVEYFHYGVNDGIAVRLNQAANLALTENFGWLLTMDQDSFFPSDCLQNYFNCVASYKNNDLVSMFGVQYVNENTKNAECSPTEVNHLITSGSIVNLQLFKQIGPFDEALFIDKVDHEYCWRASLSGYKIIQFDNIYLNHNLGNIIYGRSLKNFKLTPRVIHSPVRLYYIIRNYLYLRSKYKGKFEDRFPELKKELFIRIKNNFLYGKNRMKLIKYLAKGYQDFKAGKMGKLD